MNNRFIVLNFSFLEEKYSADGLDHLSDQSLWHLSSIKVGPSRERVLSGKAKMKIQSIFKERGLEKTSGIA